MVEFIKCGESKKADVGVVLHFSAGSFTIDTKGRLWCVINPFSCIQGENGIVDSKGNPIEILDYAIRVSKKAQQQKIKHLLKKLTPPISVILKQPF